MKLFRRSAAKDVPTSPRRHKRRPGVSFALFFAALLAESVAMQLLTQLDSETSGQVAGAHTSQNAVGSVAVPTPPQPSPLAPLTQIAPPALAAEPVGPQEIAVIFHSPLRSYRLTQYFHAGHPALDMAAPAGSPIYATTVGTVAATGYVLQGGGLMVKIAHPNGYTSYYAHMSAITATVGQRVTNGSQIGRVGSTGWATGPHLHFMLVNSKGVAVNPLGLLQ